MKWRGFCKVTATIMSVILMAGALSEASGSFVVHATSTQSQIDQTQKDKNALQQQLQQEQQNIQTLEGEQNQLMKELNQLNTERQKVLDNLADLEAKIHAKEDEISEALKALEEAKATEQWQKDTMEAQVRCMYERKDDSYLKLLISSGSMAKMLNMAYYIERVMAYDKLQLESFIAIRQQIEVEEAKLQEEKNQLQVLQALAEDERNKLSKLIADTQSSIAKYKDQLEAAEKKALEFEKAIREKENTLAQLKIKLAQEMAFSQAAQNATWRDISQVSFAENDLYLLANLIYCEAGGEPYVGQLAVGAVVINRVLSSKFPDTVAGVIYQKNQFAPVASGRLDLAMAANKATVSCYKAAEEAMKGITNVGTCVFFRTPIPGLTGIQIGGHIFY